MFGESFQEEKPPAPTWSVCERPLNEARSVCLESIEQLHYHPGKRPVAIDKSGRRWSTRTGFTHHCIRADLTALRAPTEADQSVTKGKAHCLCAWRWRWVSAALAASNYVHQLCIVLHDLTCAADLHLTLFHQLLKMSPKAASNWH